MGFSYNVHLWTRAKNVRWQKLSSQEWRSCSWLIRKQFSCNSNQFHHLRISSTRSVGYLTNDYAVACKTEHPVIDWLKNLTYYSAQQPAEFCQTPKESFWQNKLVQMTECYRCYNDWQVGYHKMILLWKSIWIGMSGVDRLDRICPQSGAECQNKEEAAGGKLTDEPGFWVGSFPQKPKNQSIFSLGHISSDFFHLSGCVFNIEKEESVCS